MPTANETEPTTRTNIITNVYDSTISKSRSFLIGVKRNIGIFLLCMLISSAVFVYNYVSKANIFKASFTVAYEDLVRKIYGDRLVKLNTLVQKEQYERVSILLSTDVKTASALEKISGSNILGQDLAEDMNADRIPFIVNMTVNDSSAINALQKGIVIFLESGNAYMAARKQIKLREIEEELSFINHQLGLMDTLKQKYSTESFSGTDMNPTQPTSSSINTIYNFSYELYKRKQELLRKKDMPETVQVLDDAIAAKPARWSLPIVIILSVVGGLFLYMVTIGFILPVVRGKD